MQDGMRHAAQMDVMVRTELRFACQVLGAIMHVGLGEVPGLAPDMEDEAVDTALGEALRAMSLHLHQEAHDSEWMHEADTKVRGQ